MSQSVQQLLEQLKERFTGVTYRPDGQFEINNRMLLSIIEAGALVENKATLEEIIVYRNRPSHLMPEHVRLALRRGT